MNAAELGAKFFRNGAMMAEFLRIGLELVAKKVEKDAKEEFGIYQPSIGEFPAWTPLAPATISDKIRKGFSVDNPLVRTGELRDSISHEVKGLTAIIGSPSIIMRYQELGTVRIPPRPVLGPAAFKNEKFIKETIGAAVVSGIMKGKPIKDTFNYEFNT